MRTFRLDSSLPLVAQDSATDVASHLV